MKLSCRFFSYMWFLRRSNGIFRHSRLYWERESPYSGSYREIETIRVSSVSSRSAHPLTREFLDPACQGVAVMQLNRVGQERSVALNPRLSGSLGNGRQGPAE